MPITKRQNELLSEIYSNYVKTGKFPNREDFRDTHPASDLKELNQLEYNMQFLKTEGPAYKFDFVYFLASPFGEDELSLTFSVALRANELYPKYKRKGVFYTEFQKEFSIPEPDLRRALNYLSELRHLNFSRQELHEMVFMYESIREIETADSLIPPYARTKWLEETGEIPKQTLQDRAFGSLIGNGFGRDSESTNEPASWEALPLGWIKSEKLQKIVERDYDECRKALLGEAYKAALVMAGACMEGVLLAGLLRKYDENTAAKEAMDSELETLGKNWKRALVLNELELQRLIALSVKHGLIKEPQQKLSDIVLDYRNYIHPGKEMRKDVMSFDRLEVANTVNILRLVSRDIHAHYQTQKV